MNCTHCCWSLVLNHAPSTIIFVHTLPQRLAYWALLILTQNWCTMSCVLPGVFCIGQVYLIIMLILNYFSPSYRFLHYASTSAFVVVLEAGEQGKRPRNQPTRSIFTIFCCLKIITACLRCCSELLPNFPFKEQYSIPAFACLICGYYPVHCSHSKMMSCW